MNTIDREDPNEPDATENRETNIASTCSAEAEPDKDELVERLDRIWSTPSHNRSQDPIGRPVVFAGYQIGRYKIERVIGAGGFGVVFKALDSQLDRDVAVKIPRPEVLVDPAKLRRFENEALAAARLDHPSIMPIYEAKLDGPTPYIASVFCPGPNLAQWMTATPAARPWQDVARFIAQLASAADYAHQQGVLHRDLKPSNVMLFPNTAGQELLPLLSDYQPRLTDFGLAWLAQSGLAGTRSSVILGTPRYMAPEQFDGLRATKQAAGSDIYALGVMLYELLTGIPPIDGASYVQMVDRHRQMTPPRLIKLRADVPKQLDVICAKCLEKDPAARYLSAADLASDLMSLSRGDMVRVRQASSRNRFRYWRSQPQRIRDAGWYSLCIHIFMSVWLLILLFALPQFDLLTREGYFNTLMESAQLLATWHLPAIFLAWHTLRGRRWAIWGGVVNSLPGFAIPLLGVVGLVSLFPDVYRNAEYHAFAMISLISCSTGVQLLLYVFALLALRKRTEVEGTVPSTNGLTATAVNVARQAIE